MTSKNCYPIDSLPIKKAMEDYTLGDLPVELLHLIASNDKEVYRTLALAGIRKFFVTLTPSIMTDYRIKFGYSVKITSKSIRWYINGKYHRMGEPAIELNGVKIWCIYGNWDREDKPTVEVVNGTKMWYIHRELHRTDGPAIEWVGGGKEWYINGKRQRDGLEE